VGGGSKLDILGNGPLTPGQCTLTLAMGVEEGQTHTPASNNIFSIVILILVEVELEHFVNPPADGCRGHDREHSRDGTFEEATETRGGVDEMKTIPQPPDCLLALSLR